MTNRKALGKGLDALFQQHVQEYETPGTAAPSGRRIVTVPIRDITPNRNQPREYFANEAMHELKQSIAEHGILEPPVVRRNGAVYELIAGERRFRAARELNFDTIEVIVMDVETDDKMLVLSLIENIQRENLNAIEEGRAYLAIMERMETTQEELAGIVGKSRSAVANTMRLLTLPQQVQDMVSAGRIAPGSARALITVNDEELAILLAEKIAAEGLSARKAEELVKKALAPAPEKPAPAAMPPLVEAVREDLQRRMGTVVRIKGNNGKGRIEIEYFSTDDLERILETLKGGPLE